MAKLFKAGNSKVIAIPPAYLKLLNIDENTELDITIKGKSLVITAIKEVKKN